MISIRLASLAAIVLGVSFLGYVSPARAQSSQCGKSTNVSKIFGSLAGALGKKIAGDDFGRTLSSTIACALSKREQERASASQNDALNSGKTGTASRRTWSSDEHKGVGGGTIVVARSTDAGQQCAIQRTFITDVDGKEKSVERELCQKSDGRWAEA